MITFTLTDLFFVLGILASGIIFGIFYILFWNWIKKFI